MMQLSERMPAVKPQRPGHRVLSDSVISKRLAGSEVSKTPTDQVHINIKTRRRYYLMELNGLFCQPCGARPLMKRGPHVQTPSPKHCRRSEEGCVEQSVRKRHQDAARK